MKKLITGLVFVALAVALFAASFTTSRTPASLWVQIHPYGQSAKDLPVFEAALPQLEQVPHVVAVHPADSGAYLYLGETELQLQPWIPGLEPEHPEPEHPEPGLVEHGFPGRGPQGNEIVVPAALDSLVGSTQEATYHQWLAADRGEEAQISVQITGTYTASQLPQRWPGDVGYVHPELFRQLTMAKNAPAHAEQLPGDFEWPAVYLRIDDAAHQHDVIHGVRDLGYAAQKLEAPSGTAGAVTGADLLPWAGGLSLLIGLGLIVAWYRSPLKS